MVESSAQLALRNMSMLFKTNFGCYIGGMKYVSDSTVFFFLPKLVHFYSTTQMPGVYAYALKYNITA